MAALAKRLSFASNQLDRVIVREVSWRTGCIRPYFANRIEGAAHYCTMRRPRLQEVSRVRDKDFQQGHRPQSAMRPRAISPP